MMPSKRVTWKDESVRVVDDSGASGGENVREKVVKSENEISSNGELEKFDEPSKNKAPSKMNNAKNVEIKKNEKKNVGKSIDDGEIRTKTTYKVQNGQQSILKGTRDHELPKRSNSEPDIAIGKPQSPKKKASEKNHICIMCSPEKKFFIKNLQTQLEKHNYTCKICSSVDDYIPIAESDTIICCISLRYSKSTIAAREIAKAEKLQKPIIPLLLDNIDYPPSGPLKASMSKLVPVDCATVTFNSKWEGEEQVEEILDRLEVYIQEIRPKRNSAPKLAQTSNIPRAVNSLWREKTLPTEPLAREASEIRIQIRPPTPVRKDVSNIPLPQRLNPSRSNVTKDNTDEEEDEDYDDEEEEDEELDESGEDSDTSYVSTDSETRQARKLQKINKLPQLPDAKRHVEQNNNQNGNQKKTELQNLNNKKTQNKPATVNNGLKYDPNGKLPSVYRQKNSNRVY